MRTSLCVCVCVCVCVSMQLEAFFRGPNQSITFTDPETVKVVRKAVSVPEMRYRSVEDATFTKHNTYKGGGVVTITKVRHVTRLQTPTHTYTHTQMGL